MITKKQKGHLTELVGQLLIKNPDARESDLILYRDYLKVHSPAVLYITVEEYLGMYNQDYHSFETIARMGRLVKEMTPSLRGRTYATRKAREEAMRQLFSKRQQDLTLDKKQFSLFVC